MPSAASWCPADSALARHTSEVVVEAEAAAMLIDHEHTRALGSGASGGTRGPLPTPELFHPCMRSLFRFAEAAFQMACCNFQLSSACSNADALATAGCEGSLDGLRDSSCSSCLCERCYAEADN